MEPAPGGSDKPANWPVDDVMRILLYNFVQIDEPGKEGGGVAIYQRNLIKALRSRGHEVITLSSGDRYSLRKRPPRLVNRGHQAIIYDSPVFAPAHAAFHDLAAYTENSGLDRLAAELRGRYGEIDVLHFQNTEGLTEGFFRALRAAFPSSRILLSAHNYNLVCPQVNLWFREHKVCEDHREGLACVNCLVAADRRPFESNIRRMETILRALHLPARMPPSDPPARFVVWAVRRASAYLRHTRYWANAVKPRRRAPAKPIVIASLSLARPFAAYRTANVRLVHDVFDHVIAVSERTRQVLIDQGLPASKISVSYIGTSHAATLATARKHTKPGEVLHVAFLGYMRADKGFYFLLESLFALPDDAARRIKLTVAAPIWENYPIDRLKGLGHRFHEVVVHDGYKQAGLPGLLGDVDLGVVPVLWEDNLPQVAIEFVAHGVPILTSDRGGAQEIGSNPSFIFHAGSTRDFCAKLTAIATGATPLASFWDSPPRIYSMDAHLQDLLDRFYRPVEGKAAQAPVWSAPEMTEAPT